VDRKCRRSLEEFDDLIVLRVDALLVCDTREPGEAVDQRCHRVVALAA
jgi:hypothetical protein